MVQSEMDFGDEIELKAKVVLNVQEAARKLRELGGNISGGAADLAGQAGSAMGFGGGGANASGEPLKTKEQSERDKVRNTALQGMARSLPGGGLMSTMAKSFGQGGMMAGVATGITAVVGILTSIMKSSQVFQTMSGTIFKIIGMMADLFLMPFVPLMMKFASWMITHMPQIQEAGEKVASFIEKLVNIFTWGGRQQEAGKERGGLTGFAQQQFGKVVQPGGLIPGMGAAQTVYGMINQFGNTDGGGPRMATGSGGNMVEPHDIAAEGKGFSGKIAAWIQRFQQKEMGPGGVMERWYDEMFGGSIMPDIWGNIRGFFVGIETETASLSSRVTSDTEKLETDQKGFWDKLKFWDYLPEIWGKVKEFFTGLGGKLKDFFTFDIPLIDLGDSASTVAACFGRAKNAVVGFFTNTLPNAARAAGRGIASAASWTWGGATAVVSTIGSALKTAGIAVKNFFAETVPRWAGNAKDAVVDAAKWTWGVAQAVGGYVKSGLTTAGKAIGGFFTDTLPGWAGTAGSVVSSVASTVYNGAKSIGSWTYGGLKTAGRAIGDFFTGTLPGWANSAGSVVRGAATTVYNGAKNIGSWTYGGLQTAGRAIGSFFTGTLPGWASGAASKVSSAVSSVAGVGGWAISFLTSSLSRATSAVTSFISGLGSKVSGVASSIWSMGGLNPFARQFGNTSSNSIYAFGNSVTSGGIHAFGGSGGGPRQVMGIGGMSSGNGGITSNRVVNVNITSSMSVHDIVRDVERLDSIHEAAFFNTI